MAVAELAESWMPIFYLPERAYAVGQPDPRMLPVQRRKVLGGVINEYYRAA